jgi:hypothetical protein
MVRLASAVHRVSHRTSVAADLPGCRSASGAQNTEILGQLPARPDPTEKGRRAREGEQDRRRQGSLFEPEHNERRRQQALGYKTPAAVWAAEASPVDLPLRLDDANASPTTPLGQRQ